jgi:phage terminase large subunit GpA-like protein
VNGRKLKRGARLWTVATATFKAETYRYLRLERPAEPGAPIPAGTIHLPDWVDSEWLKQLVAEQLVTVRNKRGYSRQEWQKLRARNEALDTRVYARAAAWILGADRFDERMWRQLEKQAGVETAAITPNAAPEKPPTPQAGQVTTPRRRGWKISTPKYME